MSCRRSVHGFTLLEMTVSLALVALILLLTTGLLNQVRLVFLREQRRMLESTPGHALQLLRHDLHGARQVVNASDTWSSGPLLLSLQSGALAVWELGSSGLERRVADVGGESVSQRRIPGAVGGWRWRSLSAGLVDVELQVSRLQATGGMKITGSAPWREGELITRTFRLRLALRGALRGETW